MLFYFLIGGLLYKYRNTLLPQFKYTILFLCIFSGMAILLIEWLLVSYHTLTTWDSVYCGYSSIGGILISIGIFMLITIWCSYHSLPSHMTKACAQIGQNTLGIYYIHWILLYTIIVRIEPFLHPSLILNIIKALFLVVLSTLLSWTIKKIPLLCHLLK